MRHKKQQAEEERETEDVAMAYRNLISEVEMISVDFDVHTNRTYF